LNVFILCTGRCGSTTITRACSHITNYSSAHESLNSRVGADRLAYPDNHIEADNRLSWFLGRLDDAYGDSAFYVHLRRDDLATARSMLDRWNFGIMKAYRQTVLYAAARANPEMDPVDICLDYCHTVNANIELFLRDKSRKMNFRMESYATDFPEFWQRIGATGDYDAALAEWGIKHNAGPPRVRAA
jgi:hypothetical protein